MTPWEIVERNPFAATRHDGLFGGGGSSSTSTSANQTSVTTTSNVVSPVIVPPIDLTPIEQLGASLAGVMYAEQASSTAALQQSNQAFANAIASSGQVQIALAVFGLAALVIWALLSKGKHHLRVEL